MLENYIFVPELIILGLLSGIVGCTTAIIIMSRVFARVNYVYSITVDRAVLTMLDSINQFISDTFGETTFDDLNEFLEQHHNDDVSDLECRVIKNYNKNAHAIEFIVGCTVIHRELYHNVLFKERKHIREHR